MIRVLHFADIINDGDFIDVILDRADRSDFRLFACVRDVRSNIAAPSLPKDVPRYVLPGNRKSDIPLTALRLAALLRRHKIDILHTHHYDQAVIGWLATRLHRKTRFLIGRHYSDAIYLLSRGWRKSALLGIEARVNSAADQIIVPSKMISQLLVGQGVDSAKIKVVFYAFPAEKWRSAESAEREALRAGLGLSGLIFAQFSRMQIEKGHTYLLKAVASARERIPDLKVLLVGDGPARPEIEDEIRQLGLSGHVRLLGWRRDALKIMAAVDVVLHPTLQEAFPQTMIEALYLRKPLVITPVSGAVDIIENGVNGIMIPARNPEALASAMQLLAADPGLRLRLGEAGHRFVVCNLSVEKILPEYEEIYRSLAS